VTIQEITQSKISAFIDFPHTLYRNNNYWVPPLRKDQFHLLADSHPFWKHAEKKLFIALKNGITAGTAAAIVNHNHNSFHSDKTGFFGFFDCINDLSAASMLMDACASWLRDKGMRTMLGPMNPSTNESCGLLTEGFDLTPSVMMPYNFPYYGALLEKCGLTKAKDLLAFKRVSETAFTERFEKILQRTHRTGKMRVRPADIKQLDSELGILKEIYNDAWEQNWGFVPMTEEEIDDMAESLKPLLRPDHLLFAEYEGKPVAFTLIIPDINHALIHTKGRLTPFNILQFLWRINHAPAGRLMALGVKKEFRNHGLELLMIKETLLATRRQGWKYGELSWILEDNEKIIRTIELVGGTVYKKYRIYQKNT